jgi:hypothetical protein
MEKVQATWKLFVLICLGVFFGLVVVTWPFCGFIAALKVAAALTVASILFSAGLAFYWWTRGVGIDLGFVKIRGMGWPKEDA